MVGKERKINPPTKTKSSFRLKYVSNLSRRTTLSNKCHSKANSMSTKKTLLIRLPKYGITLENKIDGQIIQFTDVDKMQWKKKKYITDFQKNYTKAFWKKQISILEIVLPNHKDNSVSIFRKNLTTKLKRAGYTVYGFLWFLDVGDMGCYHYHFIIVIDRLKLRNKALPEELKFSNYWKGSKTIIVNHINKKLNYFIKKPIPLTEKRKRVYGKSNHFKPFKATKSK